MKTNSDSMAALFDNFADELSKMLKEGKTAVSKDGEIVSLSPDAATLSVIRQFLKDTGTNIAPGSSAKVNSIVDDLPFSGEEHDGEHTYQ